MFPITTKRKNPLGDSDSDGDDLSVKQPLKRPLLSRLSSKVLDSKPAPSIIPPLGHDDEHDPFDSYMANIDQQLDQQASSSANTVLKQSIKIDAYDDVDGLESFVEYLAHKSSIGAPTDNMGPPGSDSDEDVYRTAYAVEQQLAEKGSFKFDEPDKREIEPLKAIDHDSVEYADIEMNFYDEHEEVAAMSPAQIIELRKNNHIRIFGRDLISPVPTFSHLQLDPPVVSVLAKHGLTTPTPIQMQTLPLGLSGRDVIAIAATGSGKTLAYLLPTFPHMMDQREVQRGEGPIALIMAPTRELALQITKEAKRLCPKAYGVRTFCLVGGAEKGEQWKALRAGVDLLVATPGRLIEMVKNKATALGRVSFLVIDEADRMLEQGFEAQVRSVCRNIRPDHQTLLFSATFPKRVEKLAYEVTDEPVKVIVGAGTGSVNEDVEQIPVIFKNDSDKLNWLLQNLDTFRSDGSVIIFCTRKPAVDELVDQLTSHNFHVLGMHGDMLQPDRESVLKRFRSGANEDVLVATDIAARGLDISSIKTVVCYDPPRDIDTHTHRCGRTARAGNKGKAYVVTTADQHKWAADFVGILETSGHVPPPDLIAIAMANSRFASKNRKRGSARRGRGRGGLGEARHGGSGVLSASIKSVSQANTIMASAFVSSSKPAESAAPPGIIPSIQPTYSSGMKSSPSPPPEARTASSCTSLAVPTVALASSANPLLQALAKHRSGRPD